MNVRTKSGHVDVVVKALDSSDPNGAFEAILSTTSVDRDGEVVEAKAFAPLPERIHIDHDHGMSVLSTVGSGRPFYEGDVLRIEGTYASTARGQEVRALVAEGHITKMSVAFINAKRQVKEGVPHVTSAELLNAAFVAIPANDEALVTAAKAALKLGARNSVKDAERLQAAHDLLVENGAECGSGKAAPRPAARAVKSAAGSFEHRTELLRAAIREAHPDAYWVQVLATFEDAVTYSLDGFEDDEQRFSATYDFGDGVVTLGDPVPLGEAEDEVSPDTPVEDVSPEQEAAAPAAAPAPASDASVLAARALADECEVFLT